MRGGGLETIQRLKCIIHRFNVRFRFFVSDQNREARDTEIITMLRDSRPTLSSFDKLWTFTELRF
jgi:hypothetical protein